MNVLQMGKLIYEFYFMEFFWKTFENLNQILGSFHEVLEKSYLPKHGIFHKLDNLFSNIENFVVNHSRVFLDNEKLYFSLFNLLKKYDKLNNEKR
jgi:hypothetical protein